MVPILARHGELFIYSFTIVLALGVLAGIGLTIWRDRQSSARQWLDLILAMMAGAIIGGRIGFILFNWQYYQERTNEIWQFSQGGFNYYFAFGAGLLTLLIWSILKGKSFYQSFAKLAPAFLLFTVFAWAACWFEGCAYGKTTVIGPLSANLPDDFGVSAVRYQSQLIGLLLSFLLFILILFLSNKIQARTVFWFTIASLSFVHLVTTFLRGDPAPMWAGLRLDAWVDLLLIGTSLTMLALISQKSRNRVETGKDTNKL